MNIYLLSASILIFLLATAHSILGELKFFRHMNKVHGIPMLVGLPSLWKSENSAKLTLRMAWHITTVLGYGFAALLVYFSRLVSLNEGEIILVKMVASVMFISFFVCLVMTRGNHIGWIVFLVIGSLCVTGLYN